MSIANWIQGARAAAMAYGAKKQRDTSKEAANLAKNQEQEARRALPSQTDAEIAADQLRRRLARRQGRKSTQTESLDLAPGASSTTGGGAY